MRYLSVCSGLEAATVAFEPLGWTPLAFAEIAKFPRKVLAHHYPHVPLYGDFTLLRDMDWIGQADVLIGGPPCQSFSVAGLRGGLSDARGNLTLEFVRLADAIDNLRPVASPATIVYENVPGILSSRDNAFGALLAGLGGCDAPLVNAGPWPGAGVVAGPRRIVAWRIMDAQFHGVAQRRRRVFVLSVGRSAPCGGWSAADALLPIATNDDWHPAAIQDQGEELGAIIHRGAGGIAKCFTKRYGQRMDPETETFVQDANGIRYLTPTEVERCFGFPDGYTYIPGASAGARWSALGNSMAVPVISWIGRRINATRNP